MSKAICDKVSSGVESNSLKETPKYLKIQNSDWVMAAFSIFSR